MKEIDDAIKTIEYCIKGNKATDLYSGFKTALAALCTMKWIRTWKLTNEYSSKDILAKFQQFKQEDTHEKE